MAIIRNDLTGPAGSSSVAASSITAQFERTAARYPDRVALEDRGGALTFEALNLAANALAHAILQRWGPGDGAPIAFLLDLDNSAIITLLAILKTGRPFLALHPGNPPERLATIWADARPSGVITSRRYQALAMQAIPNHRPGHALCLDDVDLTAGGQNPGLDVEGAAPFAIFYTSGTTGEPRGLVFSHRLVSHTVQRHLDNWSIAPGDRVALLSSLSFSAAPGNVATPLICGATLCLLDLKAAAPDGILDWLESQKITVLRLTPSLFRSIFAHAPDGRILPSVRLMTLGGERARSSDVAMFRKHAPPNAMLINVFASTEAGTLATYIIGRDTPLEDGYLPAGQPMPGKEIQILDPDGQPVPRGEVGEIVVRSRYLASGYWNKPELTAERYQPDPSDPESHIVRTGDLGCWRADGLLEYRGRLDTLVKIRGYRVELAAIEARLEEHPLVRESAVVARPLKHQPDQLQLAGYVVLRERDAISAAALRQFLAESLPDYSVPAGVVILDKMPVNIHGKVDRKALPELPERAELADHDLPTTTTQQRLVGIWSEILRLERVGVNDNFFELGGDSLSVLSMMLSVEKAFSKRVPQVFFREPTLGSLARMLDQDRPEEPEGIKRFKLEGDPHQGSDAAWQRRAGRLKLFGRLRRTAKILLRNFDETLVLERILFRLSQGRTFRGMVGRFQPLAEQIWLTKLLYGRKYRLFRRLLESTGARSADSLSLFRLNLHNNLMFRLVEARAPFSARRGPAALSPYFADRQRVLEAPVERLDDYFPVEGFEHLQRAHAEGRGVILISFHGTAANRVSNRALARRLGTPPFQTIAHNTPIENSVLKGIVKDHIPASMAASLYAEVAYHGQRLLQQAHVIHIGGDMFARGPGETRSIRIADRVYTVKPGFAELALNTGARVVPVYGRFTEDGRLLTTLHPPLDPGSGPREQQVAALLEGYAAFINAALHVHPEMLLWKRIANHLRQPLA